MANEKITLEMHHGGSFQFTSVLLYRECQITLKVVDPDLVSWFEILYWIRDELGYGVNFKIFTGYQKRIWS